MLVTLGHFKVKGSIRREIKKGKIVLISLSTDIERLGNLFSYP